MKLVKVGEVIVNLEKVTDFALSDSALTDKTLIISFTDRVEIDFFGSEAEWLWLKLKSMCVYDYEQEQEDSDTIMELESDTPLKAVANYVDHVIEDTGKLVE